MLSSVIKTQSEEGRFLWVLPLSGLDKWDTVLKKLLLDFISRQDTEVIHMRKSRRAPSLSQSIFAVCLFVSECLQTSSERGDKSI